MLLRLIKYRKELADAKAENDARVMMLPLVVVGCTSAVRQSVRRPPPPPADNAASPDWQTPLNGLFHLYRVDHYAKTTEPEVY